MYPLTELPLRMKGHCLPDQGKGQEELAGCFPKAEGCLKACQKNTSAMGCEYRIPEMKCYIHTTHVAAVKKTEYEICWLFVGKYQDIC